MSAELYDFSMQLASDSCTNASRCLGIYEAKSEFDYNRVRDLLLARSWARAARTNLKIAEAELSTAPRTLKPLRARAVKGARS